MGGGRAIIKKPNLYDVNEHGQAGLQEIKTCYQKGLGIYWKEVKPKSRTTVC